MKVSRIHEKSKFSSNPIVSRSNFDLRTSALRFPNAIWEPDDKNLDLRKWDEMTISIISRSFSMMKKHGTYYSVTPRLQFFIEVLALNYFLDLFPFIPRSPAQKPAAAAGGCRDQ